MILDKNLEEAGDSILEQAKILVRRYNALAVNILKLENELDYKIEVYENTKKEIEEELNNIKQRIQDLNNKIKTTDTHKKNFAREFRFITKIDSMNKLSRRIDKLKYEEYASRREIDRLLNEKKNKS